MAHGRIHAICLVLLMAASMQAVTIPEDLPSISITLEPQNPTPSQSPSLILSGQWPDSCTPYSIDVRIVNRDSLWIDLLLPGAEDCDEPTCNPVVSAWQINSTIDPIPSGSYTVYARAVACDETGAFERIGSLRVGTGGGNGNGNGGGPIDGVFTVGERVVLLENNPLGITDLLMGQAGTVVCVGATDCPDCLLISWEAWASGRDDTEDCLAADRPVLFPPGSVLRVDPDQILIGRHFNQCGVIREGLEGCVLFETDDGRVFNLFTGGWLSTSLNEGGPIQFGDRVRLRGALNATPPDPDIVRICPQRSGDIYFPIITPCAPAGGGSDCCNLRPGDRVVLLVDNPAGVNGRRAPNLPAGTRGTVVCCDSSDAQFPTFVSWDGWQEGTNDDVFCDTPDRDYPQNSGWWMQCAQIALLSGGEPGPCPEGQVIIGAGGQSIRLVSAPGCTSTSYSGCANVSLETNFRARLSVTVTPEPGVGGNWEAWVTPEVVDQGTSTVTICVRVRNLDVSTLPPGKNTPVASISVFAVPVQ